MWDDKDFEVPLIFCRSCEIALSDDTVECPLCHRSLRQRGRIFALGGVVMFCMLLGVLLWGSGRIKSRVQRWEVSNEDVRKVAQSLVATNPAVRNPVTFSGVDQLIPPSCEEVIR